MLYSNCFSITVGQTIIEEGYVNDGAINLNMSAIYTKLIQEAGQFCDRFASDLLYDIKMIQSMIDSKTTGDCLLGFRENGVDHTTWVLSKEPDTLHDYRVIYKFSVAFADDDYYDAKITAKLQRVEYSTCDHNFEKAKQGDK